MLCVEVAKADRWKDSDAKSDEREIDGFYATQQAGTANFKSRVD